jgi:hypothetical protein
MQRVTTALMICACLAGVCVAQDAFERDLVEMKKELGKGFIIERTGVFVIAGDVSRRQFDRSKRHTVEACARALWKEFFDRKPAKPVRVYLFRGKESYNKWVEKLAGFKPRTPYGFFLRRRRSLMMNIATGGGTLVHEMTHALMDADFPDCPTWLFEGMGSLYEQCWVTRAGHIRGRVNWRLPGLRKGGFVKLETLIKTTTAEFRGDKESLNYANARYLCFYLQQRGMLARFYKAFRDAHKAGKDTTGWDTFKKTVGEGPAEFEKKWHAWVKTLKWK